MLCIAILRKPLGCTPRGATASKRNGKLRQAYITLRKPLQASSQLQVLQATSVMS
jgi:hypothetical protein